MIISDKPLARDRKQIADLVGCTVSATPEQLAAIVDRIEQQQASGRLLGFHTSVWHEASVVFGNVEKCCCVPCKLARLAKAKEA